MTRTPPADTTEHVSMDRRLRDRRVLANNPDPLSVSVQDDSTAARLGRRWGMKPKSAHWTIYGMERGIRGRCLDVIADMGPEKARVWFQPVLEALETGRVPKQTEALLGALKSTSAAEAAACRYLFVDPTPKHRKALVEALRRQSAALLAYARSLEAHE